MINYSALEMSIRQPNSCSIPLLWVMDFDETLPPRRQSYQ